MDIRLNLASRPYLNRRTVWRWLLLACSFLVLLLVINLSYGFQNYREMGQLGGRLNDLERQLADLQGVPDDYSPQKHARVMQDVAVVNRIVLADQFQWTQTFSRFEELVPDDVSIKSLQPDYKDGALKINAVAKDVTAMTEFLDRLLASDDFNQVYLLSQAETDAQSAFSLVNFALVIRSAF